MWLDEAQYPSHPSSRRSSSADEDLSKPLLPPPATSALSTKPQQSSQAQVARVAAACLLLGAAVSVVLDSRFCRWLEDYNGVTVEWMSLPWTRWHYKHLQMEAEEEEDLGYMNEGCLYLESLIKAGRAGKSSAFLPTSAAWTACEGFVASGDAATCSPSSSKVDLVYSWVNGSDARFAEARQEARWEAFGEAPPAVEDVGRQFRDHDELRYSIRSAFRSLNGSSLGNVHLVVGDVDARQDSDGGAALRCAQVPRWLNLTSTSDVSKALPASERSQMVIHPHSELFHDPSLRPAVPSFNSLAIESQLSNLLGVRDDFVYLNDDFALLAELSAADFASPLTGTIFRMQSDLLVQGSVLSEEQLDSTTKPSMLSDYETGEWKGLGLANGLLDQRFGKRDRPYLAHIAKGGNFPVLHEASQVFSSALKRTALSRFRGMSAMEAQTFFLVQHYQVEKHREALLWSFIVATCDVDRDGLLSLAERQGLLAAIALDMDTFSQPPASFNVPRPVRATLEDLDQAWDSTGSRPLATRIEFNSMDGYAYLLAPPEPEGAIARLRRAILRQRRPLQRRWPTFTTPTSSSSSSDVICSLPATCFPESFWDPQSALRSAELFMRLAFELPTCGDCLIAAVVGQSGARGLSGFLPARENLSAEQHQSSSTPNLLAINGTSWAGMDFSLSATRHHDLRAFCVSLLRRYAYSIGGSPIIFELVRSPSTAMMGLQGIGYHAFNETEQEDAQSSRWAAFIAVNDNLFGSPTIEALRAVNKAMRTWYQSIFPVPSMFELELAEAVSTPSTGNEDTLDEQEMNL